MAFLESVKNFLFDTPGTAVGGMTPVNDMGLLSRLALGFANQAQPGARMQYDRDIQAAGKLEEEQARQSNLARLAQQGGDPIALLQGAAGIDPKYLPAFADMVANKPSKDMETALNSAKLHQLLNPKTEYSFEKLDDGSLIRINKSNPNEKPTVIYQGRVKPLSPEGQLKADLDAGRITPDVYERTMAKKTAPTEKNYKQFQLQAASFADRMTKADELMKPLEDKGVDVVNEFSRGISAIPSFGLGKTIGNAVLNSDQQLYLNAAQEWIRAKLRKESGAAIGDKEMDEEYRTYFPVPGDKPEVVKQKATMRKGNTSSMIKQASGAYESQYLGEEPTNSKGKVIIFDAKGNIVK